MANISASQLVKFSCAKLWYNNKYDVTIKPSPMMCESWEEQLKKSTSQYIEMTGYHNIPKTQHRIYFSFDEVIDSRKKIILIERKECLYEDKGDRHFAMSLIQSALYLCLYKVIDSEHLQTAKFLQDKGTHPINTIPVNKKKHVVFWLIFGNNKYIIKVNDHKTYLDHFIRKAIASFDYCKAKEFDSKYKLHEVKAAIRYIEYEQIQL